MDNYQKYIAASRYARWDYDKQRRETWEETVDRYVNYWCGKYIGDDKTKPFLTSQEANKLRKAIVNLEVMPSMRCLMTAGEALDRDNVAGFNCAYITIDNPRAFDELMYILMCGTGCGFSVEEKYVAKLPDISEEFYATDTTINVADSKIGWAKSFRELISLLYVGQVPNWDMSKVRAAGEPLKTFGGRSSGPEPLDELFRFTVDLFKKASGRKLTTLEAHDLCCMIAAIVVVGGVRRSALISLSNPSDNRLRNAKSGQWWLEDNQRALANNSSCYESKPDFEFFFNEMKALYDSKSGERGIFSRKAAKIIAGRNGRRDIDFDFGTNPCSEIILRPNQFCNLSEVVVRSTDTLVELKQKVVLATILGTLQSTLVDFRYLRQIWKNNTEEECLLGVSLTGVMDHPVLSGKQEYWNEAQEGGIVNLEQTLEAMKKVAIDTNKLWAKKLGINQSVAITCVKPSGTVSQLVNSASGIHPRYSDYYIRTVRADDRDPLARYMKEVNFPCEQDVTKSTTLVFSFPQKSPEGSICVKDTSPIEQLRIWEIYQKHWAEHKPSITVYYTEDNFLDIASWMWNKFDIMSGISLMPYSDHIYKQAPYQPITKEEYDAAMALMPGDIDWAAAAKYENGTDSTTSSQELACVGGSCELAL